MNWITQFKNATPQTKWFVINWAVWIAIIVVTTIYCYARLDYVRSYNKYPHVQTKPERPKLS